MAQINSHGDIIRGRGKAWLNDQGVSVDQRCVQVGGGETCGIYRSDLPEAIIKRGCNILAAGANKFAATLENYGSFDQDDHRLPDNGYVAGDRQYAVGPTGLDGSFGYIQDYQAGKGLTIYGPTHNTALPDAWPSQSGVFIVDEDRFGYIDWHTKKIVTVGLPPVTTLAGEPVYAPSAVEAAGKWWIVYFASDATGLVMHTFDDPTKGYKLAPKPAFYPAARTIGNDVLIAWGLDPGDGGQAFKWIKPAVDPMVPLNPVVIPPEGPVWTIPGYKVPPQASYGRKGWSGPFFATDLRTGNWACPGAIEVIANGTVTAGNQQVARPCIVTLPSITGTPESNICALLGGANDGSLGAETLNAAETWLDAHGYACKTIRYFDGTPLPSEFITTSRSYDLIGIQCYPRSGEATSATIARVQECVDQIGGRRGIVLVRALNHKFGGFKAVLDLQEPLCKLVRDNANIVGDLWFSHGRSDGGAYLHPEYMLWEDELSKLFTGLP